jgi:hypothetical protein
MTVEGSTHANPGREQARSRAKAEKNGRRATQRTCNFRRSCFRPSLERRARAERATRHAPSSNREVSARKQRASFPGHCVFPISRVRDRRASIPTFPLCSRVRGEKKMDSMKEAREKGTIMTHFACYPRFFRCISSIVAQITHLQDADPALDRGEGLSRRAALRNDFNCSSPPGEERGRHPRVSNHGRA